MKKIFALITALTLLLSLVSCTSTIEIPEETTNETDAPFIEYEEETEAPLIEFEEETEAPEDIPEVTKEDIQILLNYVDEEGAKLIEELYKDGEAKLYELIILKDKIMTELEIALRDAGIKLEVDPLTGEVRFNSSILFEDMSYRLQKKGEDYLKTFIEVYSAVIFNIDGFEDIIDEIVIEGHTDSDGSYESNQKLSENRAKTVYDFMLSKEGGLDEKYIDTLEDMLEYEGFSESRLLYNDDGTEDMDSSRRVSFRIKLDIEEILLSL